ncbi:MAG TPA: hypothetical protein VNA13_02490 [Xanthomonadales bacterium]|nr:hypothetical protein [Xanthomonadales bacterium]
MKIITRNKDIAGVFGVTTGILLIPLVAMQFTTKADWNLFDFLIMGILISGTGLLIVMTGRKVKNTIHRAAIILALLVMLILTWVQLAVGIIDTWPLAGS